MITIVTPTYNRSKELETVYNSLNSQLEKDFIWLVIDDGSTDGTKYQVNNWIASSDFEIEYYYQKNSGKHVALNNGFSKVKTEYVLCLDSDDRLSNKAVKYLKEAVYSSNMDSIWAIVGPSITEDKMQKYDSLLPLKKISFRQLYDKYSYKGETYLLLNMKYIVEVGFPYYKDEKFCPENVLYDQMDNFYDIYWSRTPLYINGGYSKEGLTQNGFQLLLNNPNGMLESSFCRMASKNSSLKTRILASMRFYGLKIFFKDVDFCKKNKGIPKYIIIFGKILSPAYSIHLNNKKRSFNK